jgi:hypothetical protein
MKSRSQFPLYPIFLVVCALVIACMMFFTMHFLAFFIPPRSLMDWVNCVVLWCLLFFLLATDCVLYAQIVRYVIAYHRSQVAPSPLLTQTPPPRPQPGPRRSFRRSPYWSSQDDDGL